MSLTQQFVRERQEAQLLKQVFSKNGNGNGHVSQSVVSENVSPPNPSPKTMKKPQPFTRRGSHFGALMRR